MTILKTTIAAAGLALATVASPCFSASIIDATGDFVGNYTGPKNADLDIQSASVTFNGTAFVFTATMLGDIGLTPSANTPRYVLGFNRGTNAAPFAANGQTGVLFDFVIAIDAAGAETLTDRVSSTVTNLAAGTATISGKTISTTINASLMLTQGLPLGAYTWNFWTRTGAGLPGLADFAPDNSNLNVPEPASLALLGLAFAGLAGSRRRRA